MTVLIEKNNIVFVDVTADWCVTCKINKISTLDKKEMKSFFKENNVKLLKADWTNRNEEIAAGLAKYNRSGIPLYIFWKPGMTESKILPAVLTEDILIRNLK